ncbi:tetratricopeptide repeat protein [Tenacibaculum sp. Ill]|uniref:tetratricopeptide repeat protein n=1 Tax=Tenacibaculum sp. Ill TaxID=3445935 RepID=UPI003F799B19
MSLKKIVFIVATAFVLSCKTENKVSLDELTNKDKDSIAKKFDDMSVYFLQPSQIHRDYKDSAIAILPEKIDYIQRLSYSYKKVGDHIKAMEILNKAVDIDTAKGQVNALQYRAWTLLYYYRDYKGAIKDVDLIEKITGNKYNVCWGEPCGLQKGQALYKLGRYDEAIEEFITANKEEEKLGFDISDNHLVFFYLGRCYAEKKDYKNAINSFEKSLKGAYNMFPEAYYQLGLIYKNQKDYTKAKEYFLKAQKIPEYKMNEPYIERFDEVFPYMIEKELKGLN